MWYQMYHESKRLPWGTSTLPISGNSLRSPCCTAQENAFFHPLFLSCTPSGFFVSLLSFLSSSAGPLCWDY